MVSNADNFSCSPAMLSPFFFSCAGVIERVVISNAGDFSCPLQCGVLFTADCDIRQWASRPSDDLKILQAFEVEHPTPELTA